MAHPTTLGGPLQTPMRAELCGAIIANSAPREVGLAADSAGVVKVITRALHAIRRGRFFPYYRRPNADLWKTWFCDIEAR